MLTRRTLVLAGAGLGGLAALGFASWPRLGGYEEEVERQRRLLAAEPDMTELVRMATLAANGHNTQPWLFDLGRDRVTIRPDFSRRTEVVDPDDHHLFVSLGCAAENLALAAAASGRHATVRTIGDADPRVEVHLGGTPSPALPLYRAIPHRQSTRTIFDGQPLSSEDLGLLRAAAGGEGVVMDLRIERSDLEAILELVVAGNTVQMNDPAFVAELREWIRFTPEQALDHGDGLFAATSGNPVVPGWLARPLFGAFFTPEAENEKYRDHIRSSAGVAVFIADAEGPEHWMRAGQSFQRFALQATALGIRTAHVNQPIEVPSLRGEFAAWLGIPGRRPDLVVRFGRGPLLPMSLRRPPTDVIVRS